MHCFPSFVFQVLWLLCHVSLNILLHMIIFIWSMYFLSYKIFLNNLKRSRKFCLSVDLMLLYILGYKDFHTMCFLNLIIKQISLIFNFYEFCEISYNCFSHFHLVIQLLLETSSHPYPHIFDSSFCFLLKCNWCCPMFVDAWPSTYLPWAIFLKKTDGTFLSCLLLTDSVSLASSGILSLHAEIWFCLNLHKACVCYHYFFVSLYVKLPCWVLLTSCPGIHLPSSIPSTHSSSMILELWEAGVRYICSAWAEDAADLTLCTLVGCGSLYYSSSPENKSFWSEGGKLQ